MSEGVRAHRSEADTPGGVGHCFWGSGGTPLRVTLPFTLPPTPPDHHPHLTTGRTSQHHLLPA